jgi:hypothetical protein
MAEAIEAAAVLEPYGGLEAIPEEMISLREQGGER